MTDNEHVVVESWTAESVNDDYLNGEDTKVLSSWSNADVHVYGKFKSVDEALEAVCKANYFKFDKKSWSYDSTNKAFITSVMVDVNNCEATPAEIEDWKKGQQYLYACHLTVQLQVKTDRDFLPDEFEGYDIM